MLTWIVSGTPMREIVLDQGARKYTVVQMAEPLNSDLALGAMVFMLDEIASAAVGLNSGTLDFSNVNDIGASPHI
jgi:hypothetical protein